MPKMNFGKSFKKTKAQTATDRQTDATERITGLPLLPITLNK